MIRIYHNPQCKKSRAGLNYLQQSGHSFEVVEYLKNPLNASQLKDLISKTGLSPKALIRTQEDTFKTLYKGKDLTDDQWIEAIAAHPKLLKRPLIETERKAVLADPPEQADRILQTT